MPAPRSLLPALAFLAFTAAAPAATITAPPPGVNVRSDASVRSAYRKFLLTGSVAANWTGNVTTGDAGTVSLAWLQATLRSVNIFRALAGLQPVTFDSTLGAKCAQAALMMSANNALTHSPPPSFTFYTAAGAEAAGKSNLFFGMAGPRTIPGYIADSGAGNEPVGHRRWILSPRARVMGSGDVLGGGAFAATNALWVIPTGPVPAPRMRDGFVAWPYPGSVPHTLVFRRWSFSLPGADFSAATVRVKKGARGTAVSVVDRSVGFGENTIVFEPRGRFTAEDFSSSLLYSPHLARPARAITYSVRVSNVRLADGSRRTFAYRIKVIPAP